VQAQRRNDVLLHHAQDRPRVQAPHRRGAPHQAEDPKDHQARVHVHRAPVVRARHAEVPVLVAAVHELLPLAAEVHQLPHHRQLPRAHRGIRDDDPHVILKRAQPLRRHREAQRLLDRHVRKRDQRVLRVVAQRLHARLHRADDRRPGEEGVPDRARVSRHVIPHTALSFIAGNANLFGCETTA